MRALVEANTHILRSSQCFGNAAFLRTHMKNTLTLKSISKSIAIHDSSIPPIHIQGGRQPNKGKQRACTALLSQLTALIGSGSKAFIQMWNGTGYCGLPKQLKDGWLSMSEVAIQGTRQTSSSSNILIQVNDGRFIAHIHPTDSTNELRPLLGAKS